MLRVHHQVPAVLPGLRGVHRQVYQHPGLYPNRHQGQELLLCCQGRLRAGLVECHALRHRRRSGRSHYVHRKDDDCRPDSRRVLRSHHLRQLDKAKLPAAVLPGHRRLFAMQLAFILGYVISTLFMAVYTVAMDTLLVCFIVDENNNKGKGKKGAIHAPQDLADLMDTD